MEKIPLSIFLMLLRQFLGVVSPELRKEIEEAIKRLAEKASQTPNPWDNILVGLLKALLAIN